MSKSMRSMSRPELLAQRSNFESKLQAVAFQIGEAKRKARLTKVFMSDADFGALKAEQLRLQGLMRAVQTYLTKHRPERLLERDENRNAYNKAFLQAATELFDPEDLADVRTRTEEILNG